MKRYELHLGDCCETGNEQHFRDMVMRLLDEEQTARLIQVELDIENDPDRQEPRMFIGNTNPAESHARRVNQCKKAQQRFREKRRKERTA